MEDSPSGLWRTLGKRVGVTASRVRISYPPPGFEPRKPLESFGFRGFALIPPDCRFPPGTLRLDTSGPRPAARVTYRNRRFRKRLRAFACRVFVIEVRPRPMCPVSGPIRIPSCFPRSFFRFGSQQSQPPYRKRIAANTGRPSAKVPPETPSDERHTNAYGCHESPFEPSINSLMHRQEAKERSWRTGAGVATSLSDRPRRTSTPSSKRDIEVPAPLAGKIREHLATYVDKKPTALLFTGVRTRGTIGDYD